MTDIASDDSTFCAVHPDRETGLRCNLCGRYMCAQCAVSTPVGYRCRECVRQVESGFFTGTNTDYLIAGGVTLVGTAAVVFLGNAIGLIHMWLIAFFAGTIYGGGISQAVIWALKKRRNRHTGPVATAGVVAGALVALLLTGTLTSLGVWIFAGVAASVVYGRFR